MNNHQKSPTFHSTGQKKSKVLPGIPLIVFYWAFGLGLLGYVISSIVVDQHPLHWGFGVGGLLLGIVIGYIWFIKRGDVGLF